MSRGVVVLGVVLMLGLMGCGGPESGDAPMLDLADESVAFRVGFFDFAESSLLAELYAQALEASGVTVRRVDAAAPREVLGPALEQGQLDLLPEYLGTALSFFGEALVEPASLTIENLRSELEPRGLMALEPAPAENVNVFVVHQDSALGPTLSDLSDDAPTLRFGGPAECPDRPLCLVGLGLTYGLEFAEFVPQASLSTTAEALRREEIEVGLMFSTDASLTDEFLVLVDDRALQPPENVVPVVRLAALERWGETTVREALDRVSRELDTRNLRALNRRVAAGERVDAVAREWLILAGTGVAD